MLSPIDATYKAISERLKQLNPSIDLGKHIDHSTREFRKKIEIGPTNSEGISLVPKDSIALRMEIVAARNKSGLSALSPSAAMAKHTLHLTLYPILQMN